MDRQAPKQQPGGKPQQLALKQALAIPSTVTSQLPIVSQCTPSSPQLLAHLTAPQSIRGSSTALSFHFPFTIGSLSPVTCTQAVGRLVYSQPVSLAGTGFTVVSPSSSIPALQVLGSNTFQSHLSSTGMMMVPTLTAGPVKVSSSITSGPSLLPTNAPEATCGVPVILQSQHSAPELNFILTSPASQLQQPQQSTLLSTTSRAFTGTVHHKGAGGLIGVEGSGSKLQMIQSPARELSFAHLKSQLRQESSFSQVAKSKRPRSESVGVKTFGPFESSSSLLDEVSGELPPAKKIKLEAELSNDSEVSTYRSLYSENREKELEKKSQTYQALVMELFFLENGGHMMDYLGWQKRSAANGQLMRYLRSKKAEDLGEYSGQEKSINNEVKVLTTSGGTFPIVTPVAISKTLPPAITAMQQQQQQENAGNSNGSQLMSRKAGGRHGMVYGYVSPKAIQQCPLVPGGIPLSTTAATTTVGSPPPYTVECSSSSTAVVTIVAVTTTTVTMTSALPRARVTEGICQPTIGTSGCHVTDVYQPSLMARDQLMESRRDRLLQVSSELGLEVASEHGLPETSSASSATPAISQEAVVELAKQEAQVMQRVAELRKQGLWSLKQLPKVQEPSRHKSHWDYVLDEMQWMAVDFAQERRWKMSSAKHVAVSIMKQHDRRQQNRKLRHKAEEQRMKALASAVGKMITDFWSNMIEMALYKRQKDVELKHRRLLNYVTCDAMPLESAETEVACKQETSAKVATDDEPRGSNEIDDLIKEGDMPLDELLKKYAGAYSKEFEDDFMQLQTDSPASSSCSSTKRNGSSGGENADVEDVDMGEPVGTGSPKAAASDPIEQMIRTALSLQPTSNTCDLDTSDKSTSSSLMKLKPRDYQIVGTNWISAMHQHRIGCILSDEKGLGKKVQAIHFLSNLASEQGNWGPHLIISPSGSLFIWQMVFTRWCPALRMFVYCGDVKERLVQRINWISSESGHFHVCLTSYKCVTEDGQFFSEQTWNSLILDQADSIDSSDICEQLQRLSTEHRLLLTDLALPSIPLKQVFDLVSLAFSENLRRDFKERFGYLLPKDLSLLETGTKEYNDLTKIVHEIANVLSLRRCKEDVSGQLPKLEITTVQCPMTKRQELLYSQLMSSDEMKDVMRIGRLSDVLSLILKLKKVCNHPDLIEESSTALSPLVVDGMPLSMPSLLGGALRQDSLNTTGAWSAVTSLVRLEQDSACPVASFSSKQKPLIEELPSNSASAGESAMDIDVENTDFTDLSVCGAGGGGDAATKLQGSSLSEMSKKEKLLTDSVPDDSIKAVYGVGLQSLLRSMTSELAQKRFECGQWSSQGYVMCSQDGQPEAQQTKTTFESEATDSVTSLLNLSSECVKSLTDAVAPICSSRVVVQPGKTTHPSDSLEEHSSALESTLRSLTAEKKVAKRRSQQTLANSGKLQLLDMLMKQLISDQRRVVILSHMTQMLDLLEAYLDVCMLLYVRIDGSTKAEKRHLLVQRFNTNPKICCLLISSRTPYLPGCEWPSADAIVLFDVDLSLSMKRHADQMLHAMAQASSLTVFRFITQDTVEEFLLSHEGMLQKGIIFHDGASYTQETLNQLFIKSSLVEELIENKSPTPIPADSNLKEFPEEMFEKALNSVMDAEDAEAALLVNAHGEVASGLEGDEEAVLKILEAETDKAASPEKVKLSEIEEYAVSFIERNLEMLSKNVIKQEDDQDSLLKVTNPNKRKLESEAKTESEVKEEAEEKSEIEEKGEDSLLFTYPMDRENKQVFVSDVTGEQMPIWMPPTPPQDDSDVYADISLYFLYEPSVMSESQLPQVYVKKGHKRMKTDNANTRRVKIHREEHQLAPRSLFERPLALIRGERESRLLKQGQTKALKSSAMVPVRPMPEPPSDQPDWLIHEDWALLQAYQMHQELPVVSSLEVMSTHSSNWEVISDIVNVCSRTYRTPKQCKNRFDNVILPREEGKFLYDINPRKLKKSNKGLYKTKNNQPMRTNQLYVQDNSRALTTCFMLHVEALKGLPPKRSTALSLSSPATVGGTRNTKHIAALADLNLNYDQAVSPLQIAAMRAERLAKDKKQAPTPAVTVSAGDQQPVMPSVVNTQLRLTTQQSPGTPLVIQTGQQPTQAILQTQQQLVPGQHVAPAAAAAVVSAPLAGQDNRQQQMTIVQATGQQLQAVASGPSALLTTSLHKVVGSSTSGVTSVSLPRNLTMTGIVVTQASGLNRPQTVVTSASLVNLPTNLNQTVRALRNVVPLTIRDAVTPAISHSTINISAQDARSLAQVIATTGLTTTQLVVTQQKPAVGLPQLSAGSVQQQMLNLTGATKSQTAATIPALQVQMRQQRLGTAVLQPVRPLHLMQNQMTALLRKQPQAKTATAGATGTVQGSLNVQQIPRQQQQQIEGVTLQQQQAQQPQQQGVASSAVTQSVTTLLKAVSPAASLSTVTIPVSAVSLGINVTHPKLVSGKAANSPQQLRQLQVPKRGPAVQFAASKVTALGPMAKSVSSSPVILQQQKFLPQPLPTRYQHLISSSAGTVIAAQIIHQSNPQPSLPASVTAAAASSKASVTVTIAGSSGLSGVATIPMSSLCQVTNASVATTAVRVMPTQGMMYAKQNKDGFVGIQKTMVVPAGLQQVTVRPAAAQQPQQQAATSQLLQGAHITMTTSNKAVASLTPVEKAVQEVVQQAQAQARQVPPISFAGTNVVVSAVPQGSQAQVVATVPAPQHLLVTSVVPQPAIGSSATAGAVSTASSPAAGSDDSQQNKSSASYAMKLRNQRS